MWELAASTEKDCRFILRAGLIIGARLGNVQDLLTVAYLERGRRLGLGFFSGVGIGKMCYWVEVFLPCVRSNIGQYT